MGDEDNESDEYGTDGGDEYHAGGDVFGVFGVEVVLVGEQVDHLFECGVDGFGDEDDHDGEADDYPFEITNMEIDAGKDHTRCGDEVKAEVWLGLKSEDDPVPCV